MDTEGNLTIRVGDRIDHVAERALTDARRFADIINANPTIDPLDLEAGELIEVTQ